MCVCVHACVCAHVCACMCVCVCARACVCAGLSWCVTFAAIVCRNYRSLFMTRGCGYGHWEIYVALKEVYEKSCDLM